MILEVIWPSKIRCLAAVLLRVYVSISGETLKPCNIQQDYMQTQSKRSCNWCLKRFGGMGSLVQQHTKFLSTTTFTSHWQFPFVANPNKLCNPMQLKNQVYFIVNSGFTKFQVTTHLLQLKFHGFVGFEKFPIQSKFHGVVWFYATTRNLPSLGYIWLWVDKHILNIPVDICKTKIYIQSEWRYFVPCTLF